MNESEFKKLIKKDKYQVFLFRTPLSRPLNFAAHFYFVINDLGKINRYEIGYWKDKKSNNYLHVNLLPPTQGFIKSFMGYYHGIYGKFTGLDSYESTLISKIEGNKGSTAYKMVKFISKEAKNYPLRNRYFGFPGPNSNTFIQWIINKFPESKFKLPWNAFGKNYQYK